MIFICVYAARLTRSVHEEEGKKKKKMMGVGIEEGEEPG